MIKTALMLLTVIVITILNLIYIFINAEIPSLSIMDQVDSEHWPWQEGFYN